MGLVCEEQWDNENRTLIRTSCELQARKARKRGHASPTKSEMPVKRRRGTQTTVQGNHLDKVPGM